MPLIHQLEPDPDEGLADYVDRLARRNYYRSSVAIRGLLARRDLRLDLLRTAQDYTVLADLTGQPLDRLFGLTLHRFVPAYYPAAALAVLPHHDGEIARPLWEARWQTRYMRGPEAAVLCPRCWVERPGRRQAWALRHVTWCRAHGIPLMDRCDGCGRGLTSANTTGRCAGCGRAFGHFTLAGSGPDGLDQALITWIGQALVTGSSSGWAYAEDRSPDHPLRHLTPPALLRFLWRMGQLLWARDPANPAWSLLTSPPTLRRPWASRPGTFHTLLRAAGQILWEWPGAWYGVLERIARQEADWSGVQTVQRWPQVLLQGWRGPEWTWLRQGWVDFMQVEMLHNPDLARWLPYYRAIERQTASPVLVNGTEVTDQLRVGRPLLVNYVQQGLLRATAGPPAAERRIYWIAVDSVAEFTHARAQLVNLTGAARRLGIANRQVQELVAAGRVRREPDAPIRLGRARWVFRVADLDTFLATLLGSCGAPADSPATGLDLGTVMRRVLPPGVALVDLLADIETGRLPAWRAGEVAHLGDLRVDPKTLQHYLEEQAGSDGQALYAQARVCRMLGCTPSTLVRWEAAGLLQAQRPPAGRAKPYRWYRAADVQAFAARYIRAREAAQRLGCAVTTITKWARAGRVPVAPGRTAGNGVYRVDWEAFQARIGNQATVRAVAAELGVAENTIYAWQKGGQLPVGSWTGRRHNARGIPPEAVAARKAEQAERMTGVAVAARLGVHVQTIWHMVKAGKLQRHGGAHERPWFARSEIERWVAAQGAAGSVGLGQ